MPTAPGMHPRETVTEAHSGAPRLAFLERYRFAVLGAFTLFYFAGTVLRARSSPMWHDEIYTILVSRLDLPRMWEAVRQGIDPTPPLTDLLVRGVNSLWGEGNIVSRIPAMIAFWVFCLSLFVFVRRRLEIQYAFAAMMLPFSTGAYAYAIQARCYGIILGLCGVALVSWQAAVEGRRRAIALPLLAVSLAAALFSHFYAVLLFLPFGGAELWRAWRRKRIDWPVWGALAAGALGGAALCYPLVAGASRFKGHPWAVPHMQLLTGFYPDILQPMLIVFVALMVLAAAWWILRGRISPRSDTVWHIPEHEAAAGILFLLLPVAGYLMAKFVTQMFAPRYFIWAIAGVILLAVFETAIWSRGSSAAGTLLLLAAALPAAWVVSHHLQYQEVVDTEPLLRDAIAQGPIVMDDGIHFLEQWYYLPPSLKSRVAYISDPASDARWVGHDTIDVGMQGLRRWFGVPVLDYEQTARPGASFRIYHNASGPVWLPQRLLQDGVRLDVLATTGDRAVLRATVATPPRPPLP